jgi:hypothetical protein
VANSVLFGGAAVMSGHDLVTLDNVYAKPEAVEEVASYPRCPQPEALAAGAQPTPTPPPGARSAVVVRVGNLRAGSRFDKLKHVSAYLPDVLGQIVRLPLRENAS